MRGRERGGEGRGEWGGRGRRGREGGRASNFLLVLMRGQHTCRSQQEEARWRGNFVYRAFLSPLCWERDSITRSAISDFLTRISLGR